MFKTNFKQILSPLCLQHFCSEHWNHSSLARCSRWDPKYSSEVNALRRTNPHSPALLTVCPGPPAAKERTERWAKRGEEREKTWGKCQQGRQLGRGILFPLGNNGAHRKGLCSWGQHRRAAVSLNRDCVGQQPGVQPWTPPVWGRESLTRAEVQMRVCRKDSNTNITELR